MYVAPTRGEHARPELTIRGEMIERVHELVYPGSIIGDTYTLGMAEDVQRRVKEASKMFGRMKAIWKSRKLSRSVGRRLLITYVGSVLLYGSENWDLTQAASRALNKFWYRCIRSILGITWERVRMEYITNERAARRLGVRCV